MALPDLAYDGGQISTELVRSMAKAASVVGQIDPSLRTGTDRVFAGVDQGRGSFRKFRNFPHFARTQLWVIDKITGLPVPFELNWIQRQVYVAELRARKNGVRPFFIILKYRRGGVTTLEQGLGYWTIWNTPNAVAHTFAHRSKDTRLIFRMVEHFYENQPERNRHKRTDAAVNHIEFLEWKSMFIAETAGATAAARGSRLSRIHLSEASSYPALRELHRGILDTAAPDAAYIIESTANGKTGIGEDFWRFWKTARARDSAFIPLFFPWHSDPHNRMRLITPDEMDHLSSEEASMVVRFNLDKEQIKWWRAKRRELVADGRSGMDVYQEHPNDMESCFIEGGNSYYAAEHIDRAFARCRDPIKPGDLTRDYGPLMTDIENGRLRIWEEPQEGAAYVIGADPAEGVGGDDTALCGANVETGEQAFSWNHNWIPPDECGQKVLGGGREPQDRQWGLGWIWRGGDMDDPAYAIVERENHGHAFLTGALKLSNYPIHRIHHEIDEHKDEMKAEPKAGWRHNHGELTQAVGRAIREEFPICRDIETVRSIKNVANEKSVAVFSGRDLAVAWGLVMIGIDYATGPGRYAMIGGVIVDMVTGKIVDPKKK